MTVKKGTCRMCGQSYMFNDEKPPCTVSFFGKDFYANLCWRCSLRITRFIKLYRKRDRWKNMVV